MTGFPPITDSDGGMGFGPELFLEEFFFFCCLPLILLYIVIAYFNVRRKWKQHDALEAKNQALKISESPEGMENKITKYLGGRKKQIELEDIRKAWTIITLLAMYLAMLVI